MGKWIDLHTHTVCSDGSMTPEELVYHAKASGLSAIAVTDHDSVEGIRRAMAAGKEAGVEVIPAIELSALSDTQTHILGYFIDPESSELLAALDSIREKRTLRVAETCEMLAEHGISIPFAEVKAMAENGVLCRAHIAKLMTEKGYAASPKEAFLKWLNPGCPCYSNAQALTDIQAIELIQKAGGDAYLAHLHLSKTDEAELEAFLKYLMGAGLKGIETYYTDYSPGMFRDYFELAKKYKLKMSGGTDFHGAFKPHIFIGRGTGNLVLPYSILDRMRE